MNKSPSTHQTQFTYQNLKQKFIKCLDNSYKINYWSKMPQKPI